MRSRVPSSPGRPPTTLLRADKAEIERAISVLFRDGDVIEVRIPKTFAGVVSGYFDSQAAMITAIAGADAKYRAAGLYYTLNRLDPALLGRAHNRLRERAEYTTADNNILRRRWLPVDLDSVRPAGISSSDEEHDAALERAQLISADMTKKWGEPILADSGNGAHLLYAIDYPNNAEMSKLVIDALSFLDRRYSDNVIKVDITSANPARIWKAYGTVARKGDCIPGRPHRLSKILKVPEC